MKKILFFALLISNFILAQETNYYSLEKNGEKYPKIVRYILLNRGEKIIHNSNTLFFNIDKQRFKHINNTHITDTCSTSTLNKIKTVSINELIKDEYAEHLKRSKENGKKIPFPFNHYNSTVFIIEKLSPEKIIKYEVDWIYSIE